MKEPTERQTLSKPVVAYCDGSFNPVTRFGGWSFEVHAEHQKVAESGACEGEASTDMEVLAAVKLLEGTDPSQPLLIFSDCKAVVESGKKLASGAKLKLGKLRDALRSLYERLEALLQNRKVSFKWVRGHSGVAGNTAVDHRAKACMRKASKTWEATMDAAHQDRIWDSAPNARWSVLGA